MEMSKRRLYGYLRIPDDTSHVQVTKSPSHADEGEDILAIAGEVVDSMQDGRLYILGPGTTTKGIADVLGVPKTLLGVDVVLDGGLVASDVTESQLIELLDGGRPAKIVVTAIGGQGHIFGRGNQQIGADVIRRVGTDNIIVVATRRKLGFAGSAGRSWSTPAAGRLDRDVQRLHHGHDRTGRSRRWSRSPTDRADKQASPEGCSGSRWRV